MFLRHVEGMENSFPALRDLAESISRGWPPHRVLGAIHSRCPGSRRHGSGSEGGPDGPEGEARRARRARLAEPVGRGGAPPGGGGGGYGGESVWALRRPAFSVQAAPDASEMQGDAAGTGREGEIGERSAGSDTRSGRTGRIADGDDGTRKRRVERTRDTRHGGNSTPKASACAAACVADDYCAWRATTRAACPCPGARRENPSTRALWARKQSRQRGIRSHPCPRFRFPCARPDFFPRQPTLSQPTFQSQSLLWQPTLFLL